MISYKSTAEEVSFKYLLHKIWFKIRFQTQKLCLHKWIWEWKS